jgi:DNA-binding NtrC family response regulator
MIRLHKFRSDLFYRLNVVQVRVPPLRERKDDIPLLVRHFIEKHCAEMKIPAKKIGSDALEYLKEQKTWTGNVRELENTMLRALVFSSQEHITLESLRDTKTEKPGITELRPFIIQQTGSIELGKDSLEQLRKDILNDISRMIDTEFLERLRLQFKGNIQEIARSTGINRTYLYRMMERAGFDAKQFKQD